MNHTEMNQPQKNVHSHQSTASSRASRTGSASTASVSSDRRGAQTAETAPSSRKKYPWTLKRVLAWVLIAALVSMYLVTFVLSLSSSLAAGTAFRASLLLTIALPVIAWIFIWAVGALQHRTSIASLKLLNSNPEARKEMEKAVQESEKKEKNNTSKSK